jgi:catechol 2,3-dioxygenase-like lactoylglutathione lyase family enzyme
MNPGAGHGPQDMTTSLFTQAATVYVAVTDQARALAFYAGTLGFETRADFPYADGARWIEVVPPGAATSLALLPAGDARPAGVETGVALNVRDAAAAHAELRARGVDVDAAVLREGDPVVHWAGAVLAGIPPMFRFRDPDGNSFLAGEGP